MSKIINILFVLIVCLLFFVLGNYIYSLENVHLIAKILISEGSFIVLYTITDKSNIKYGFVFSGLVALMYLGFFVVANTTNLVSFLFYSVYVQNFSILIAVSVSILNALILKNLLKRNILQIMSSRISTFFASTIEVILFSFLLDIGVEGALITFFVRLAYIYLVPKLLFKNS